MPIYYKENTSGQLEEIKSDVYDFSWDVIILTKKEFLEIFEDQQPLIKKIESLKNELTVTNESFEEFIEETKKNEKFLQDLLDSASKEHDHTKKMLLETRKKLEAQESLNHNLVRIMKERANQARGIRPKKDHDGYIVLRSREWLETCEIETWDSEEHRQSYNTDTDKDAARHLGYLVIRKEAVKCWKSEIQTPYNSSLPQQLIEDRIYEDLKNKVLADLNVTQIQIADPSTKGSYVDFGYDEDGNKINGLYQLKYVANYKSGFWELEIYTTGSLEVPEYRRPKK